MVIDRKDSVRITTLTFMKKKPLVELFPLYIDLLIWKQVKKPDYKNVRDIIR